MTIENLANNQIIINEGNKSVFNSYGINVAQKVNGQITLDEKYWDYSRTTIKYLSLFLGEASKKFIEKGIKEGVYLLDNLNK